MYEDVEFNTNLNPTVTVKAAWDTNTDTGLKQNMYLGKRLFD